MGHGSDLSALIYSAEELSPDPLEMTQAALAHGHVLLRQGVLIMRGAPDGQTTSDPL